MIGLFDRDVFLKLGCCNLWSEALEALGVDQPTRLVSTSSRSSNRSILKRWLSGPLLAEAELRIQQMVVDVPVISDKLVNERDEALMARLEGVEDIDAGERLLISILNVAPAERMLLSGDKRFLIALVNDQPDLYAAVGASLVSFERCLLAVQGSKGFDIIQERCLPVCECDNSLRLAFGTNPNASDFSRAITSLDPLPHDVE